MLLCQPPWLQRCLPADSARPVTVFVHLCGFRASVHLGIEAHWAGQDAERCKIAVSARKRIS